MCSPSWHHEVNAKSWIHDIHPRADKSGIWVKNGIVWGSWRRDGRAEMWSNAKYWYEVNAIVKYLGNGHTLSIWVNPIKKIWSSCRGFFGRGRFQLTLYQLFLPQHISAAHSFHQLPVFSICTLAAPFSLLLQHVSASPRPPLIQQLLHLHPSS